MKLWWFAPILLIAGCGGSGATGTATGSKTSSPWVGSYSGSARSLALQNFVFGTGTMTVQADGSMVLDIPDFKGADVYVEGRWNNDGSFSGKNCLTGNAKQECWAPNNRIFLEDGYTKVFLENANGGDIAQVWFNRN